MAHLVVIWQSDAVVLNYYYIGSIQRSPEGMRSEISDTDEQQYNIGYDCVFVEGEESSESYTKTFFANFFGKKYHFCR